MTSELRHCGLIISLCAALAHSSAAVAQPACDESRAVARLVTMQGTVQLDRTAAKRDDWVCPGVVVDVGAESRAALLLVGQDTILRIDQNTRYVVAPADEENVVVELLRGILYFFSNVPQSLRIKTPFVNATIEGTELVVDVDEARTDVIVLDGRVLLHNARNELVLGSGEAARTGAEGVPARIQVAPGDAVKWALYYPPLGSLTGEVEELREAARLLTVGRVDEASAILEAFPAESSEAAYTPRDSAVASALLSIIATTQNRRAEALSSARDATALAPDSSVAHTALSYAQQGSFLIEEALASAQRAAEEDPSNGHAWARLSELRLAVGDHRGALEAGEMAVKQTPGASRTQSVLGFAQLAGFDTESAASSFQRAIGYDANDPLPWLGLGLTRIKTGGVQAGRREIEMAKSLDVESALIRSYLAKVYLEEGREEDGNAELELAKKMDPNDPTPWLYGAVYKHASNRPVEALRDLRKSISLNDNRAVYRSRLLLDEDLATRSTSLARVFNTLGFGQLSIIEASTSVSADPGNFSAHRFLADSFAGRPRHEIARSSELLRSQLLQPLNVNPVQPAFVETDLDPVSGIGPRNVAFNEYTPLFIENRAHLLVTGASGTLDTNGGEVVVSGIENRFSYSLATASQGSDGFRSNNDFDHDIDNMFGQVAITNAANLQFEYRKRETTRGDLRQNFDPEDFSPLDRFDIESESPRLGFRWSPSPQSDVLLSWIHTDRTEETFQFLGGPTVDTNLETEADDYSAQYITRRDKWNLVTGVGTVDITRDERFVFDQSALLPPGACAGASCLMIEESTTPIEQDSVYLYANLLAGDDTRWTIGGSYDRVDLGDREVKEFNPKLGLQWNIADSTRLRMAYFENLRRTILSQQVLEPTQIAGFNQLFDDFNGTDTRSTALGLDWSGKSGGWVRELFGGIELVHRDIGLPILGMEGEAIEEEQNEDEVRVWGYATIGDRWSAAVELFVERFNREAPLGVDPLREVETISLPLTLRYFAPNGFFAGIRATYLDQKITSDIPSTREQSDSTGLVDLTFGYRLSNRKGLISFEIGNLFDEQFQYQDQNNRSVFPRSSRLFAERTFLAKVTLNF